MLNEEELDKSIEIFLEHHGVKGQKWGIRNDRGHEGKRTRIKKIGRLDKRFAAASQDPRTTIKVWNGAAAEGQKHIDRINNKPEYKNKDFTRDSLLRQKYYKEIQTHMINSLENSAKRLGTNASGTQRYGILEHPDGSWDIVVKDVKHDNTSSNVVLTIKPNFDSTGHIISFTVQEKSLLHTDLIVEDILEHHGVKGQKWGIRNKRVAVRKGRKGKPSVATTRRQAKSMSDEALQTRIKRLELEKRYVDLSKQTSSSGKKYASEILQNNGKTIVGSVVGTTTAFLVKNALKKKFGGK